MPPLALGGPPTFDTCSYYDVDYEEVLRDKLRPNASWKTAPCRHGWHYDLEQTRYPTIVSEVHLKGNHCAALLTARESIWVLYSLYKMAQWSVTNWLGNRKWQVCFPMIAILIDPATRIIVITNELSIYRIKDFLMQSVEDFSRRHIGQYHSKREKTKGTHINFLV